MNLQKSVKFIAKNLHKKVFEKLSRENLVDLNKGLLKGGLCSQFWSSFAYRLEEVAGDERVLQNLKENVL